MEEATLRNALARIPAGVVLVVTRDAAGYRGVTATTFTGVSLDPPLVLVCLDRLSTSRDAVVAHAAFTASVLPVGSQFLADRFSGQAPIAAAGWEEIPHRVGANGLPVVADAIAWLECEVVSVTPAGDHDIVIGSVTAAGGGGGEPLLYWERGYWSLRP